MMPGIGLETWSSQDWRAAVLTWVDDRLHERGITRIATDPAPRMRTWATTLRLLTDHGDVWFKAASSATAHEIAIYPLLARTAPRSVLTPLAVDIDRSWMILPHGGTTLMHSVSREDLYGWLQVILPRYAQLQIDLMPHRHTLLDLGVHDMRPARMPERFDEALIAIRDVSQRDSHPGDDALLERIAALRSEYVALCEELAASPIPPSLDHGDLHANNILPDVDGSPRIFDWGDSSVAHPFTTLLEFRRFTAEALDVDQEDTIVDDLRDTYLSCFADFGTHSELLRMTDIASRVAMVNRALTYLRTMALGPLPDPSWNRIPFDLMASLLHPSNLG